MSTCREREKVLLEETLGAHFVILFFRLGFLFADIEANSGKNVILKLSFCFVSFLQYFSSVLVPNVIIGLTC